MEKHILNKVDIPIYHERISNGLEVYLIPDNDSSSFYITLTCKYGALDTEFKVDNKKYKVPQGIAHFLEHKMFEDEDGDVFDKAAILGSNVNAYTNQDITCYEISSSNMFKENLELLLDFVQKPYFTKENVEKEKGIIKEEILRGYDDPYRLLYYKIEENLNICDKHKYTVAGTVDDIKKLTKEDLELVYNTFYTPDNMVLIITGKFNETEALAIIKENQANKTFNKVNREIIKKKEPIKVNKDIDTINMNISIPKVGIAFKIDKTLFKEYDDITLTEYLTLILDLKYSTLSNLYNKLYDANILNQDISIIDEIRDDYIFIYIYVSTIYKEQVIDEIVNELDKLDIKEEDLTRAKRGMMAGIIYSLENIWSLNESLLDDIVRFNNPYIDYFDIVNNFNLKDLNNIITKLGNNVKTITYIKD